MAARFGEYFAHGIGGREDRWTARHIASTHSGKITPDPERLNAMQRRRR